jgi:hypothetical protein
MRKHGTARSEAAEIKRMGAKAQANSGRGKVKKGDAILDGYWLIDVKETVKSFTLSLDVWRKVCSDAIKSGNLEPVLNVVFGRAGGTEGPAVRHHRRRV